jgi:hypothetical protein
MQRGLVPIYRRSAQHICPIKQSKNNALPLKTGPIGCPKTSLTNYQPVLRNDQEERRSDLHCGRGLKSRLVLFLSGPHLPCFTRSSTRTSEPMI